MSRVALVNPQLSQSSWDAPLLRGWADASIKQGLASLSACLKEKGHDVSLVDLRRLRGWSDYDAILRREKWDWLGVTANTGEHYDAVECCRRAKRIQPSLLTIAGGIQPTMFPGEFLETGAVDYVLRGEGEVSLARWAENPSGSPPILQGETPDLDRLPFVDRELWPDYDERMMFPWMGRHLATPIVEILGYRGCPWHCRFCCGPGERNVFSKARARSVEHVMRELAEVHDRHPFKGVFFHDDQFLIDPAWVENFCAAMHERGFVEKGVEFAISLRVDTILKHEPLVRKLKEAGLAIISIGFESFNDRLLQWMNKGVSRAQSMEAVKVLRDLKVKFRANIMLGLPGPDGKWNPEDDYRTMKMLRQINPDMAVFSVFSPIPGSYFYEWYKSQGMLLSDDFRHLAKRGGAAQLKGVNYDFLDALIGRKAEQGGKSGPDA
jgi:anaerobic magnesium-protoporphyrin IX monomethyl ester cyclase